MPQNTITEDPNLIANTFNDYFAGVYASSETAKDNFSIPRGRPVQNLTTNSLYLSPTTEQEVYKTIRSLKNTHSCGTDEIPSTLLRFCAAELAPPLTTLINQSFLEGIVPEELKVAIIKPIFKKGNSLPNCL
jgi:hypothetical protein